MPSYRSPVECFRRRLEQTLQAVQNRDRIQHYSVVAIIRTLLNDFNHTFSSAAPHPLDPLIEKHCYSDITICPMCGSQLVLRKGKYGPFHGCTQYPACKGSRKLDGRPGMGKIMQDFLTKKEKEAEEEQKVLNSRFSQVEF